MNVNNFLQSEQPSSSALLQQTPLVLLSEQFMKILRRFCRFRTNIRLSVLYLPEPELSHRRLRSMMP